MFRHETGDLLKGGKGQKRRKSKLSPILLYRGQNLKNKEFLLSEEKSHPCIHLTKILSLGTLHHSQELAIPHFKKMPRKSLEYKLQNRVTE